MRFEREVGIYHKLMQMSTKHVFQVLDFIRDDEYVALVTEFADGGDLQHVRRRTRQWAWACPFGRRKRSLEHRDGSAENSTITTLSIEILKPQQHVGHRATPGSWPISAFPKIVSHAVTQKTFQQYGTLGYAAPEQFQGVEAKPSADIYSLGKILVFLLTGQTDLDHVTYWAWRNLINRCLRIDPSQRPLIDKLIEELDSLPA